MKKIAVVLAAVALLATATPAGADHSRYHVKQQIRRAWKGRDVKAIRVANCESSLNPNARSPGGTYLGLWQFSRTTWKEYGGPGRDPRAVSAYRQTVIAWRLFRDRRWTPWPYCRSA